MESGVFGVENPQHLCPGLPVAFLGAAWIKETLRCVFRCQQKKTSQAGSWGAAGEEEAGLGHDMGIPVGGGLCSHTRSSQSVVLVEN